MAAPQGVTKVNETVRAKTKTPATVRNMQEKRLIIHASKALWITT
jgi:hypothetical protein